MFNLLILIFPLLIVLAFFSPESFRGHFWPFTDVLREIWWPVTRKIIKTTADYADFTNGRV